MRQERESAGQMVNIRGQKKEPETGSQTVSVKSLSSMKKKKCQHVIFSDRVPVNLCHFCYAVLHG